MTGNVYTEAGQDFYDAALTYWRCVKDDGETATSTALAGMKMTALAVEAFRAGASKGEIELLRSTAKLIVLGVPNNGNQS